jgi:hypothetical protein
VSYYERTNGNRHSNLKVAIKHLVEALKVYTKSSHRDDWANTHEHLTMSYGKLVVTAHGGASLTKVSKEELAEEKSALIEKCIVSCTNALQVLTPTYDPASW